MIVLLAALLLGGCKKISASQDAVSAVSLSGIPKRQQGEVREGLATRASPRFLSLFPQGFILEYETFDQEALDKDLLRIERQLRRRGYYEAHVRAARVIRVAENEVRVELEVDPGDQVTIRKVRTEGLAKLPFDAGRHALRAVELQAGEPFDEDAYEQAKVSLANALADVGYAYVEVSGSAQVDLTDDSAEVVLVVEPGPRATLGKVVIEGLDQVPEGPVRDALQLQEGQRYSRRKLELARSALFELGVFSKVEVVPVLADSNRTEVPITVQLEESALRSITAGGGLTLDVLRLSAHGQLGWTHRNFFGGLRKFSISTRPGVTFFPTRFDNLVAPTRLLPENALKMRLEQPSFLEGRTTGFTELGYNVYPLLYPLPEGTPPAEERIIGYNEIAAAAGARRLFFGRHLPITLSMNWRSNFPFTYQGQLVEGLNPVVVSFPELDVLYDLRDDPIQPKKGLVISNALQVAVPILGGKVTDVRIRPEVRTYIPLDFARRVVLASRLTLGMVFPQNYGDALLEAGPNVDYSDPAIIDDQHKLLFRAFYSGGPNSNRGYPYQRVGPQGPIGFLVPSGENCNGPIDQLRTSCIRPLGGFSLWEASVELRFDTLGPWGFVAFVDASDVSSKIATFNLQEPHISVGPGVRYRSPVGPIRLDVGWRVPGLQKVAGNADEPPDISEVSPYVDQTWYESFALHLLIGEAF